MKYQLIATKSSVLRKSLGGDLLRNQYLRVLLPECENAYD